MNVESKPEAEFVIDDGGQLDEHKIVVAECVSLTEPAEQKDESSLVTPANCIKLVEATVSWPMSITKYIWNGTTLREHFAHS